MNLSRVLIVVAVLLLCVLAVGFVNAVWVAQEAAREASCRGRMAQLHVALASYEFANGHLPPAYILGPDGKPWHSWRVLVLPYFEQQEIYDQYRFDEPWNGPNNRKLADKIRLNIFQCPGGSETGRTQNTNYVGVVGNGTAFPGDKTTRFADFTDGKENTILLVEVADSGIHWMEPRDIELDSLAIGKSSGALPAISSAHPRGPAAVFADSIHAHRLSQTIQPDKLRALVTIAGGEPVARDSTPENSTP
jgi:hypothetical protein